MCRSHAEKVTANHIRQPLVWSSEPVLGFKWILSAESAGILVLVGTVMLGFPRPCDQPGTALLALILPRNRSAVAHATETSWSLCRIAVDDESYLTARLFALTARSIARASERESEGRGGAKRT